MFKKLERMLKRLFQKQVVAKHVHDYSNCVGLYYVDSPTPFRDQFDHVYAYVRVKCKDCGEIEDRKLATYQFLPTKYCAKSDKRQFIDNLKKQGFVQKHEIEMVEYNLFHMIDASRKDL